MAEPTGGLTFQDLIIRVAEYLGIAYYGENGNEAAQVPVDAHDLDLCKRLVNDGIRMFVSESIHPVTGQPFSWRWMRKLYTLTISNSDVAETVNNDPGRYIMPEDFNGDAMGDWTFGPDQNVWPEIKTIPEHVIRQWKSIHDNQAGIPHYAAFRPLEPDEVPEGTRARWEVLFYPDPGQEYVVQLPYRHFFNALVDLTDRQPAGAEHDATIEAAAKAMAELERDDTQGSRMVLYQKQLANSIRLDSLAAPKTVGQNLDRSGRPLITNRKQLGYSRPVLPPSYQTP